MIIKFTTRHLASIWHWTFGSDKVILIKRTLSTKKIVEDPINIWLFKTNIVQILMNGFESNITSRIHPMYLTLFTCWLTSKSLHLGCSYSQNLRLLLAKKSEINSIRYLGTKKHWLYIAIYQLMLVRNPKIIGIFSPVHRK